MKGGVRTIAVLMLGLLISGCPDDGTRYFDSDGVTLAYSIQGQGPPLVLVHGFMGTGALHWELTGTAGMLAKHFQVILLDCRGHGKSGKPTAPEDYGLAMVEDVRRLLDHLEIDRTYLVGYSMGAWISLKFAATYPERVDALAVGGAGLRDGEEKNLVMAVNNALMSFVHEDYDVDASWACAEAFPALALAEEEVADLPSGMLLLSGGRDFNLEQVTRLAEARPDASLTVLPGHTHATTLFAPRFRRTLMAFFLSAQAQEASATRWVGSVER